MKKLLSLLLVIVFTYGLIQRVGQAKPNPVDLQRSEILSPSPTPIPDKRIEKIESFLSRFGSPMVGSGKYFIEASDRYKIDYRLLPAIAGVESTLGKFVPGCAVYNSFGYTSSTSPCGFYRFESYKEAIFTVAETISRNKAYIQWQKSGELEDLAKVYNAMDTKKWVADVIWFINQI